MGIVTGIITVLMAVIYYLFNANKNLRRDADLKDLNSALSGVLSEKEKQDAIAKKAQEDYERARTELLSNRTDSRNSDGDV